MDSYILDFMNPLSRWTLRVCRNFIAVRSMKIGGRCFLDLLKANLKK